MDGIESEIKNDKFIGSLAVEIGCGNGLVTTCVEKWTGVRRVLSIFEITSQILKILIEDIGTKSSLDS